MRALATVILFVVTFSAVAQEKRLLFHFSRKKEAIYYIGEVISFRVKGSDERKTWQITNITDSTIVSGKQSIAPHRIGVVYVDQKTKDWIWLRNKYQYFYAAGVAYFLIDWINSKEIDRSTVIISGTFVAAGVISTILIKDYIKLKRGRKLVILR